MTWGLTHISYADLRLNLLEGAAERGIQVTCLRFDDGRFLGVREQGLIFNALPVDSKDEKTGPAGIEQLAN
jgi:hypothetical protein